MRRLTSIAPVLLTLSACASTAEPASADPDLLIECADAGQSLCVVETDLGQIVALDPSQEWAVGSIATMVDPGGPEVTIDTATAALQTTVDLLDAAAIAVVTRHGSDLTPECETSIANYVDAVGQAGRRHHGPPTVPERCDLQEAVDAYLPRETQQVEKALAGFGIDGYNVVGSGFASARWAGITRLLAVDQRPDYLAIATPLNINTHGAALSGTIADVNVAVWNQVVDDPCAFGCEIDTKDLLGPCNRRTCVVLDHFTGTEYSSAATLLASSRVLAADGDGMRRALSDPDSLELMASTFLRLDPLGDVDAHLWFDHLVGMCATTGPWNDPILDLTVLGNDAVELVIFVSSLYAPCLDIERTEVRPAPVDEDFTPAACLIAVEGDPVVGYAGSLGDGPVVNTSLRTITHPILHGDISIAADLLAPGKVTLPESPCGPDEGR